jgi:hypothetical protein
LKEDIVEIQASQLEGYDIDKDLNAMRNKQRFSVIETSRRSYNWAHCAKAASSMWLGSGIQNGPVYFCRAPRRFRDGVWANTKKKPRHCEFMIFY